MSIDRRDRRLCQDWTGAGKSLGSYVIYETSVRIPSICFFRTSITHWDQMISSRGKISELMKNVSISSGFGVRTIQCSYDALFTMRKSLNANVLSKNLRKACDWAEEIRVFILKLLDDLSSK